MPPSAGRLETVPAEVLRETWSGRDGIIVHENGPGKRVARFVELQGNHDELEATGSSGQMTSCDVAAATAS